MGVHGVPADLSASEMQARVLDGRGRTVLSEQRRVSSASVQSNKKRSRSKRADERTLHIIWEERATECTVPVACGLQG
jgi:hypothetical protein